MTGKNDFTISEILRMIIIRDAIRDYKNKYLNPIKFYPIDY